MPDPEALLADGVQGGGVTVIITMVVPAGVTQPLDNVAVSVYVPPFKLMAEGMDGL